MWKNIGLALAKVGGYALRGALWASTHTDVVSSVAAVAGHPEVAAAVKTAGSVISAVKGNS